MMFAKKSQIKKKVFYFFVHLIFHVIFFIFCIVSVVFIKDLKIFFFNITRLNFALDRCTILCLYVPGFQRQVFKHVKFFSEGSERMKEKKKNKGSVYEKKI